MFLNTHDFEIKKHYKTTRTYWYIGETSKKNLTGIYLGKRGKKSLQLVVYDKRYSPNKIDHRFSSHNYSRLEYRIGSRILRKYLSINLIKDLRAFQNEFPKHIISYCRKKRDLIFKNERNFDKYFTDLDFENAVGREVDNPNAESTKIELIS